MDEKSYQFDVINHLHPSYGEASSLIRMVYCRKYAAFLPGIYKDLIVVFEAAKPVAAVGFNPAKNEPLFLECYLNLPIELAMQAQSIDAKRKTIVEIGHMVSTIRQGSWTLIQITAEYMISKGYAWLVFTATEDLRGIFDYLGVQLNALAAAKKSSLSSVSTKQAWGTYYESNPVVVAACVHQMLEAVTSKPETQQHMKYFSRRTIDAR